jgi:putative transposase
MGGAWRPVPPALPPWGIVSPSFWPGRFASPWQRLHETGRGDLRALAGCLRLSRAALMDAQTVITPARGEAKGFDGAPQRPGHTRQLLGDTLGLLRAVGRTAASRHDRDRAQRLWGIRRHGSSRLRCLWADGAAAGSLATGVPWVCSERTVHLDSVKRAATATGGLVLPKRWMAERPFAWGEKYRRLSKDYAYRTVTRAALLDVTLRHLMVREIAAKTPSSTRSQTWSQVRPGANSPWTKRRKVVNTSHVIG